VRHVSWVVSFMILATGCSATSPDAEIAAILADSTDLSEGGGGRGVEDHDFGPVLARGQTLRHQFTFTNSTKQPIRLIGTTATTPCCSEIGPISKEPIPPGGQCPIPVILKVLPGKVETKRVGFIIQTDSKEHPNLTYGLRAAVYPEWEIQASTESSRTLPIGRAGRQVMRITCRRLAGEGDGLPTQVEVESPVAARFLADPREQTEPDGVTSIVRDVEIALPASDKPGPHQVSLRFHWPEGRTREQVVLWGVVPPIRAIPSRLSLRQSERDQSHTIVIRSFDDQPFRVSDVGPQHLVLSSEFDHEAGSTHTLKLRIDPDRAAKENHPQITIKTDASDQSAVSLSILILPPGV
jgi:uncharacterized protein DUF1573